MKEKEVDKNKGWKQTACRGKPFMTGQGGGQLRQMPLKIKDCKISTRHREVR